MKCDQCTKKECISCPHGGTLYIRGIPATLKQQFKALCYSNGTTMRDAIVEYMRYQIEEKAPRK